MAYKINELTDQEIQERKEKYPTTKPKRYQVQEDDSDMILADFNDRVDAEAEVIRWKGRDLISEKIERMIGECILDGQQFGLDPTEIRLMIKEGG